jgi:hypothetical protein
VCLHAILSKLILFIVALVLFLVDTSLNLNERVGGGALSPLLLVALLYNNKSTKCSNVAPSAWITNHCLFVFVLLLLILVIIVYIVYFILPLLIIFFRIAPVFGIISTVTHGAFSLCRL